MCVYDLSYTCQPFGGKSPWLGCEEHKSFWREKKAFGGKNTTTIGRKNPVVIVEKLQ
jgi:hypothetical protein